MCRFFVNPLCVPKQTEAEAIEQPFERPGILRFHQSLPGYRKTELQNLSGLAHKLNIGRLIVKDESERFDLKAFKILGGSWAIKCWFEDRFDTQLADMCELSVLCSQLNGKDKITLATATDGNHGRGVARMARWLSLRAVIYMPSNSVVARIEHIRNEGAEVVIVDGSYDRAVSQVQVDASRNGWQIISDTSWDGYETIPRNVMAGYQTLFSEQVEELQDVDIVFVQGGVGALTAATAYYFTRIAKKRPRIVSVEPDSIACLFESACVASRDSYQTVSIDGISNTIMAGLNCGSPSKVAWPIIRDSVDLFLTIPDQYAKDAMRLYFHAQGSDPSIESGESGAAGLGGLLALLNEPNMTQARVAIGLNSQSKVLLVNTEGATDRESYERIVF